MRGPLLARQPKEPALSHASRHRAPQPQGRPGLLARLVAGGHPRLFLPTALACAGLLIAAPLAILFSGGLPGGSGSGSGPGGSGSVQGGSGPGTFQPGVGGPGLTTAARSTDANGQPLPAAERNAVAGQATLTGQAPQGAVGANGGSTGGGAVGAPGGSGGGGGLAGGRPVGGGGGTGGGGGAQAGGGGSGGGGGTPRGGSGPTTSSVAPGGCMCSAASTAVAGVSSAVASVTKAVPVPLPQPTTPSLPTLPLP